MTEYVKEKKDCWEFLKNTELPVFIYGMGDGALKIMKALEEYSIPIAGFFASDEFVRGHSFQGHLVHKLSQIEALIDDFVIVLAFAAGYESLYRQVNEIAARHTLVAPDVPVAGDGLFTYGYYLQNKKSFDAVYELLDDEKSRQTYADIINFKISGKIEYLNCCIADDIDELVPVSDSEIFVDMGAYNGDTVEKFCKAASGKYKHIYAFEPNIKNFRKLQKNTEMLDNITLFNACAWDKSEKIYLTKNEGRMSCVSENGRVETECIAADKVISENATLIKLDVEGAERKALLGAKRHVSGGAKVISALYHRNEDMFDIPLLVHEMNPALKLHIRHTLYIPAWETNLYAY